MNDSICWDCAERLGSTSFDVPHYPTAWTGTCDLCGGNTTCVAWRDYKWPNDERPSVEEARARLGYGEGKE